MALELWQWILIVIAVILGINILFKSLAFVFRAIIIVVIILILYYFLRDPVVALLVNN